MRQALTARATGRQDLKHKGNRWATFTQQQPLLLSEQKGTGVNKKRAFLFFEESQERALHLLHWRKYETLDRRDRQERATQWDTHNCSWLFLAQTQTRSLSHTQKNIYSDYTRTTQSLSVPPNPSAIVLYLSLTWGRWQESQTPEWARLSLMLSPARV